VEFKDKRDLKAAVSVKFSIQNFAGINYFMPFTIAHPAATVPILKTYPKSLILSALVIGSMSPDFEYFLRLKLETRWSHTPLGVFTFCLPVSLIVLWIYHNLQKDALVLLLPNIVQNQLLPFCGRFDFGGIKQFFVICFSIIIGASTHLIWDGFTHSNGFLVEWWDFLRLTIVSTEYFQLKLYQLFQDVSTLCGLLLLGFWCWKTTVANSSNVYPEFSQYSGHHKSKILTCLGLGTILLAAIILISIKDSLYIGSIRDIIRYIAVVIIPSAYIVAIIYGGIYKFGKIIKTEQKSR
jgi:hypothetical protein